MSDSADKRSVSTDALETLGMVHFREEKRDAIHLAVMPVEAGETLMPGQHIGVVNGKAFMEHQPIGIVDPFLPRPIEAGERFWLVIYPRKIQSLRHVWSHPALPDEGAVPAFAPGERELAYTYLVQVAERHGVDIGELLAGAENSLAGGDGLCFGTDIDYSFIDIEKVWRSYELVTGKTVPAGKREWFFRCAC